MVGNDGRKSPNNHTYRQRKCKDKKTVCCIRRINRFSSIKSEKRYPLHRIDIEIPDEFLVIDNGVGMTKEYRNNMFERIRSGSCSDETSVLFSQILTDFERIGDHALNIAEEYAM